jgi:electron transfer flavoprotein beta subunit
MQSLTGPMTAARCNLPCAAAVVDLTLDQENRTVTAICELTGGLHETVRLPLPAVITVQSGINQPRYASLSNRLRAKSQAVRTIPAAAADLPEKRQQTLSVFVPVKTGAGEFIPGSLEEKALTLIDILHQKSLI